MATKGEQEITQIGGSITIKGDISGKSDTIPYTLLDPTIINKQNFAVIDIIFANKYE